VNATTPPGVGPPDAATDAVKVTDWPGLMALAELLRVVVVE
jgi:hypothetical protein